jgi:hypothetical protein
MSFWKGFEKVAKVGVKSLKPLSTAGRMVGNKPSTMVSTTSHFKPTAIPTAKPAAPKNNSNVKLPIQNELSTAKPKVKPSPTGPTGTKI